MTNAHFITASGTDCGKSFVTTLLIRYAHLMGHKIHAAKPVLSGTNHIDDDAALLLDALHINDINAINTYRFNAPLSPHRAAELEQAIINSQHLIEWCKQWLHSHAPHTRLIEGVGGVMVPLTYEMTVRDWISALSLPAIFITRDTLGSISHSLCALHALYEKNIPLTAHIVNSDPNGVEHDNMCNTLRALSPYDAPVLSLSYCDEATQTLLEQQAMPRDHDFITRNQPFFDFVDSILT